MATSIDFYEYIKELLRDINGISYRKMMGEYIIYYRDVVVGGIYDNRLLAKKTSTNEKYQLKEALPYKGGSMMYLIDAEDVEEIKDIVLATYKGLM